MTGKIEIKLGKPVYDDLGKPVEKLAMRRPTGEEILECGYPYSQKRNPRTREVTEEVAALPMYQLIGICSGIPLNAVAALDPADLYECIEVMRLFFHYKIRRPSSDITSRPENGAATAASSSG